MSQVLYRKWRPRRLDEVVGQEAVTRTLRNAVVLDRVSHAYLFCGPRGTGKTSTARIMAKAVNCLSPQDGEPDNQCEICLTINESRALDLIEIDGASNRGIDDIRNLREKVHYSPNQASHKVYIVDEVHMLTEPAFNALLKTLEEPPAHVIFVLATTEAHKVPLTIISRCQRFDFRRIPAETMTARLAQLCEAEGIEAESEALGLMVRKAAGSLRDAENLLEQALLSYGSPLTAEQVSDLLELGSDERALELVGHIVHRSVKDGLTLVDQLAGEGVDLRQLHRGVLEFLRGLLLTKSGARVSLGYAEEAQGQIASLSEQASMEHLLRALKAFSSADVRRDGSTSLPLELALVESSLEVEPRQPSSVATSAAAAPATLPARRARPNSAAQGRADAVARAPAAIRETPEAAVPAPPMADRDSSPPPTPVESPPPASQPTGGGGSDDPPLTPASRIESEWAAIVRSLSRHKGRRFNLGALLRDCKEREVAGGVITLKFSYRSHMERMQGELDDPEASKALKDTVSKAMGGSYDIVVSVVEGQGNGPRQSAAQRSHLVRAAQAMGAHVVDEREEKPNE